MGCAPTVTLPPESSPPAFFVEKVRSSSPFAFEGFSVGSMRVDHYRRSALKKGREVTRIRLTEDGQQWRVSCLLELEGERVSRVCVVAQEGAYGVLVLRGKGTQPLSGELHGWIPLTLAGVPKDASMLTTYTPGLVAHTDAGPLGNVVGMGAWTKVRISRQADADQRSWMRLLGLLHATLSDPRDADIGDSCGADADGDLMPWGDSYKLRMRQKTDTPPDPEQLAALLELGAQLDHDGNNEVARQVRRLRALLRDEVFDEEAGALAQRMPIRGPVVELAGGPTWLSEPGDELDSKADGGRFHLAVGVRLYQRTTITMGMGMQFPAFSLKHLSERPDAPGGRYSSGALNVDLTGRHAFGPIVEGLEPVVGLSLRTRLAFLDYQHPTLPLPEDLDSHVASHHVGLGVAPIAGLQWAFKLNTFGSRFVLFTEFQPEIMFWPTRNASDQSDGAFTEAAVVEGLFRDIGSEPTLQLGTMAGVRLEL